MFRAGLPEVPTISFQPSRRPIMDSRADTTSTATSMLESDPQDHPEAQPLVDMGDQHSTGGTLVQDPDDPEAQPLLEMGDQLSIEGTLVQAPDDSTEGQLSASFLDTRH